MTLKAANWSSYQSYKDRKPPWIRLHKTLLDNFEFHCMSVNARALLPMLWLLASEHSDPTSGIIDQDAKKIAFRLRMTIKDVESGIKELISACFFESISVSNESVTEQLQDCVESVTPETEKRQRREEKNEFDEFWSSYPKKKNKGTAEKAWKKIKPTNGTIALMMKGLESAKSSSDWQKDNGQFIPYPATWLNAKGWEDEYETHHSSQLTENQL